jgi:hypothetical protein
MTASSTSAAPRVARLLGRGHLKILLGFWAVMLVGWAGTVTTVETLGDMRTSMWWWFTRTTPKYFVLVLGILAGSVYLPRFIAYGITRRDVRVGAGAVLAVVALAFAALVLVGFGIEYGVYSNTGILGRLYDPYPISSVGDAVGIGVRTTLLCLIYPVTGWVLGAGYYRLGLWRGSLVLIPGIAPLFLAEAALDADRLASRFVLGTAAAAACVLAAAVLGHFLTRDMPVRPTAG